MSVNDYVEAITENKAINGGNYADWKDAAHIVDTYDMLERLDASGLEQLQDILGSMKAIEAFIEATDDYHGVWYSTDSVILGYRLSSSETPSEAAERFGESVTFGRW